MRVSLRRDDPAYDSNADYEVFLDGSPVDHVITADEEAGEVICKAVDDSGNFIIDDQDFVDERHFGRMEIRPRSYSASTKAFARSA